MAGDDTVRVEVVYARKHDACQIPLDVARGSTLREAVVRSGILEKFPEIDLAVNAAGVFSQRRELDDIVEEGDRIEIYRPLEVDPKEARRRRAGKKNRQRGHA